MVEANSLIADQSDPTLPTTAPNTDKKAKTCAASLARKLPSAKAILSALLASLALSTLSHLLSGTCQLTDMDNQVQLLTDSLNISDHSPLPFQNIAKVNVPTQIMTPLAIISILIGAMASFVGAKVAPTIFGLMLALYVFTIMIRFEAPSLESSPHFDWILVTDFRVAAWVGNFSSLPQTHGPEFVTKLDVSCTLSLAFAIFVSAITVLFAPIFFKIALFVAGAISGFFVMSLAAQFVPQLSYIDPEKAAKTKAIIGFPLFPFWVAAGAISLVFTVKLMQDSYNFLIVTSAILGSASVVKGLQILVDIHEGHHLVEAVPSRFHPHLIPGLIQLAVFGLGLVVQCVWFGAPRPEYSELLDKGDGPVVMSREEFEDEQEEMRKRRSRLSRSGHSTPRRHIPLV